MDWTIRKSYGLESRPLTMDKRYELTLKTVLKDMKEADTDGYKEHCKGIIRGMKWAALDLLGPDSEEYKAAEKAEYEHVYNQ